MPIKLSFQFHTPIDADINVNNCTSFKLNDETKSDYISAVENNVSIGVFEHVEQMLQNDGDIDNIIDELEQAIIKSSESFMYVKHTRKTSMKKT